MHILGQHRDEHRPNRMVGRLFSRPSLRKIALLLVTAMSLALPRVADAANKTWNDTGGGNDWSQGGNWSSDSAPTTADDVFFGSSFNSSTINLNVAGSTRSFSIYTNNTWTISTANSSALLISSGSLTRTSAVGGTQTISTGVTLGANAVWAINGSGGLVVSGVITDGGSTFNLTKSGTGLLVLSGANVYGGTTTISGGTLQIGNGSTTGSIGAAAVTNNATLAFNRSDALTFSNAISGTGSVTQLGSGTTTLSGSNTYSGGTTISAGRLLLTSTNALGSGNGSLAVNGGTLDLAGRSFTIGPLSGSSGGVITSGSAGTIALTSNASTNSTFGGAILNGSGTIALTKTGTGILTLTGTGNYTGATTVSQGAINIQNALALGGTTGSTTVSSGAALQIQNNITVTGEALSLSGSGVNNDGALRNISGTNTYAGVVTLGSAGRINSDAGLLTLNTGTITGSGFGLSVGGAGDTTISSIIGTGTGSLTKDGAGTLTLTAANTYTGATTVTAGELNIQNSLALGGTAAGTTVAAGGVLQLQNGITVTGEALSLSGAGVNNDGALRNISGAK